MVRLVVVAVSVGLAGVAGVLSTPWARDAPAVGTHPASVTTAGRGATLPSGASEDPGARAGTTSPSGTGVSPSAPEGASSRPGGSSVPPVAAGRRPLRGRVVLIDPGHQLGNSRHLAKINQLVDGGGFQKPCNTTGTATDSGYPEATFTFSVAVHLKERLEALGATVRMTRDRNSTRLWGPCIDVRGRLGERVGADALVSVHADGAPASRSGFFVIHPTSRRGWTDDIAASSQTLGRDVRAGLRAVDLPYANYNGGDGLLARGDLGTLNWSDVPAVMVELGNMRNPDDAAHMRSSRWRSDVYAAGLERGLRRFLAREP